MLHVYTSFHYDHVVRLLFIFFTSPIYPRSINGEGGTDPLMEKSWYGGGNNIRGLSNIPLLDVAGEGKNSVLMEENSVTMRMLGVGGFLCCGSSVVPDRIDSVTASRPCATR